MMTTSFVNGYFVNGINNVKVRFFPQVIGIFKIHEHNLSNALRDFALMTKSDHAKELANYKNDIINFVHLMRPSEICMVAHGYSQIQLDDVNWWSRFNDITSNITYDIDAQEIAGFIHSITRIYKTQQPIICKLLDEFTYWTKHTTTASLTLLVRAVANVKLNPGYLEMFNTRAIELHDQLNILDVLLLLTSNSQAQIKNVNLYTKLCMRAIALLDDMEYHHIRAIAASISVGGYKSHLMFNILTIRLIRILENRTMSEGDLISLLLSFTRQFFVTKELNIDPNLYTDILFKYGYEVDEEKFRFPLKEIYPTFCNTINEKLDFIVAKGMPILLRAIYVLKIPVEKKIMDRIFERTAVFIKDNSYTLDKILLLIYTASRFREQNTSFWKAIYELLSRSNLDRISKGELIKALVHVGLSGKDSLYCAESRYKYMTYKLLLDYSKKSIKYMDDKAAYQLLTHCFENEESTIIADAEFIESLTASINEISTTNLVIILRLYYDFYKINELPMTQFSKLLDSIRTRIQDDSNTTPCKFTLVND